MEKELATKIQNECEKYFKNITILETNTHILILATEKKQPLRDFSAYPKFENENRGQDAKMQSLQLIEILNKIKSN